jgi:hypothetical protein
MKHVIHRNKKTAVILKMSGVVTTLDYNIVRPTNILAIGRDLYVSDESDLNGAKIFTITPDGGIKQYNCASINTGVHDLLLNNICYFLNSLGGMTLINDTLYIADAINNKIFTKSCIYLKNID